MFQVSRHVLYSLVGAEGGATAGAGVSDLLQVVHTVRHQAAAQPQPEDAAAEGEDVLDGAGLCPDGGAHMLPALGAHQAHWAAAKPDGLKKMNINNSDMRLTCTWYTV